MTPSQQTKVEQSNLTVNEESLLIKNLQVDEAFLSFLSISQLVQDGVDQQHQSLSPVSSNQCR